MVGIVGLLKSFPYKSQYAAGGGAGHVYVSKPVPVEGLTPSGSSVQKYSTHPITRTLFNVTLGHLRRLPAVGCDTCNFVVHERNDPGGTLHRRVRIRA